jgi:hypothetical protein
MFYQSSLTQISHPPRTVARPPRAFSYSLCVAAALFAPFALASSFGSTWYVNAKYGNDTYSGSKTTQSFKTINQACSVVQPGDTVILASGVYFENVNLWTLGTSTQPITFQGQTRAKNVVTITGADPSFRNGLVPWTLVDSTLNLYSAPCSWSPGRVLCAQTDLYPYASLNDLRTFTSDGTTPGPREGFFHDSNARRLYVRLNSKYGWVNPAQNMMKVGPPAGGGPNGIWITDSSGADFTIHNQGSGNIIFDGITFETPRVAGIATKVNDVTVQNCYFIGCRSAVCGLGTTTAPISNVTIQYCEYTLFPTFNDVIDQVQTAYQNPTLNASLPDLWWWQRKTMPYTYEVGFVLGVGVNWKIKNNYLHDVVDALSGWGMGNSKNLEISGNVIARTIDNSVEVGKGHESYMYVHDNVMLDSFEPINYQPLSGTPWPYNLYVAHNVIADTAQGASPWKYMTHERGAFKFVLGSSSATSFAIPGDGLIANNNTVLMYNGNMFSFGNVDPLKLTNANFYNNFVVSKYAFQLAYQQSPTFDFSGFNCQGNTAASATANQPGPAARAAGASGQLFQFNSEAKLVNPSQYNFRPASGSPLLGAGVNQSQAYKLSTDVGAYSANGPTTLPVAGIQPDAGSTPSTSIPTP